MDLTRDTHVLFPYLHATAPADLAGSLQDAARTVIRSVSGWRSVFAKDGEEESRNAEVAEVKLMIVALAVSLFANVVMRRSENCKTFLLACDTRPTGIPLCSAAAATLLAKGAPLCYLGTAAAPELFAYAGHEGLPFVYITASHNPIGHNGIKFGRNGAVLDREASLQLIRTFNDLMIDSASLQSMVSTLSEQLQNVAAADLDAVVADAHKHKKAAAVAYTGLTNAVGFGHPDTGAEIASLKADLTSAICYGNRITVVADHNGGARTQSIDGSYLSEMGLDYRALNDTAGSVVHKIEPEGEALEECLFALRGVREGIGYVSDNDGDRGNLVITDASADARVLPAQTVFALVCASELLWVRCIVDAGLAEEKPLAIVANGPTSLRVDEICESVGAKLFRAEVGEANVLGRAAALREEGFRVRLVGEGSNGGNITYPGQVRDPLSTVLSVVKLLRGSIGDISLKARFVKLFGARKDDPSLSDLVDVLPRYATTPTSETRAKLRIRSTEHGKLKASYERLFPAEFEKRRGMLEQRFGVTDYHFVNFEGTTVVYGPGGRHGEERGGMSVMLTDAKKRPRGFLWMRGSGTEPVFRIMADIKEGSEDAEAELLEWQAAMVRRADLLGNHQRPGPPQKSSRCR